MHPRLKARWIAVLAVGIVQLAAAASASALGQISYGGCVSDDGSGGLCAEARGRPLTGARVSDTSPDGRNVYIASFNAGAVAVLNRGPDGQLTYAGCVSNNGSQGACADAPGSPLTGANSVKVSPDGKSVYVAALDGNTIAVFDRASGGQLTYAGCVSSDGSGGLCADVPGSILTRPAAVALSPDGKSLYASVSTGVTVFDRASGGQLTYAGCVSNDGSGGLCAELPGTPLAEAKSLAVSGGGTSVYVAGFTSNTITAFDRAPGGQLSYAGCVSSDGSGGLCADAPGTLLDQPSSVAISPADDTLYVTSFDEDAVAVLDRATGGQISYAGCVSDTGSGGLCADAPGTPLNAADSVSVSPDGGSVYTAASVGGLAVFDRATGGQITYTGCVSNDGSGGLCADPPGTPLTAASSIAVTPDDGSVYATAFTANTVLHFFRKTAPQTSIDTGPADGSAIANRRPSFAFSANQAGASFECSLDGGTFATCSSPTTTPGLSDGAHSIAVRAATGGDVDRTPARRAFRVDTTGPSVRIVRAPKKKVRSAKRKRQVRFAFTASEPGAGFECKLDKRPFRTCSSPRRFKVGRGKHRFVVRATDSLGNTGQPVRRTFRVVKQKRK